MKNQLRAFSEFKLFKTILSEGESEGAREMSSVECDEGS